MSRSNGRGETISTIDLYGGRFVLLAGPAGGAWRDAAAQVASDDRPELVAYTVGDGGDVADPDGAWLAAYGLAADGAILVRPDGYVGWRSQGGASDPAGELRQALDRILTRA